MATCRSPMVRCFNDAPTVLETPGVHAFPLCDLSTEATPDSTFCCGSQAETSLRRPSRQTPETSDFLDLNGPMNGALSSSGPRVAIYNLCNGQCPWVLLLPLNKHHLRNRPSDPAMLGTKCKATRKLQDFQRKERLFNKPPCGFQLGPHLGYT